MLKKSKRNKQENSTRIISLWDVITSLRALRSPTLCQEGEAGCKLILVATEAPTDSTCCGNHRRIMASFSWALASFQQMVLDSTLIGGGPGKHASDTGALAPQPPTGNDNVFRTNHAGWHHWRESWRTHGVPARVTREHSVPLTAHCVNPPL